MHGVTIQIQIELLVAGDTDIEGTILQGIATLPWRKLHLQENGMQGSIPDELSSGSPAKIGLEELWLQNSTFERDVTDWFGRPMTTTLPQCFGIFGFPTTMVFEAEDRIQCVIVSRGIKGNIRVG